MKKKMTATLTFFLCCILGGFPALADSKPGPGPGITGLYALYAQNREQGVANYITADFLLLSYSMLRRQDLQLVEQQVVMPALTELVAAWQLALEPEKGEVAQANREFMAVLAALAQGRSGVDEPGATPLAAGELGLILKAQGIAPSPLWGYPLDYSQFKPRGSYDSSEQRRNYFRAMRYASGVLFAVKASEATGISGELADRLTGQALMLTRLLAANPEAREQYEKAFEQLAFRFGRPDDLMPADLLSLAQNKEITGAQARETLFDLARTKGRQPSILSNVVDHGKLEKGVTASDALTGFRLFPQFYAADSAFFQALVAPEGGEYKGGKHPFGLAVINGKQVKGFPSAYELMAQYGSKAAGEVVEKEGGMALSGYQTVLARGQKELAMATGSEAIEVEMLQILFEGAPNDEKRLESGLAFWTWQRYVNLLYTKQSMTGMAKGMLFPGSEARVGAALEPLVGLYNGLARAVARYAEMEKATNGTRWREFGIVVDRCIRIASTVKLGAALSDEDQDFLNNLDTSLAALTGGQDQPIVVDIHTEPNSQLVVEEGTGYPVVEEKGKARGGRLSHYEFKQPMEQRLTDGEWQTMLRDGKVPKR
jgi:hypothetical protein